MEATGKLKRSRNANFSEDEKFELVSLVKKYKYILESKETNKIFSKQKSETWIKLEEEFNMLNISVTRTWLQLKTCYESLKHAARKENNIRQLELYKADEGVEVPEISDISIKVLEVIEDQGSPPQNPYNSDANYSNDISLHEEEIKIEFPRRQIRRNACFPRFLSLSEKPNSISKTSDSISENENQNEDFAKMKKEKHDMEMKLLEIQIKNAEDDNKIKQLQLEVLLIQKKSEELKYDEMCKKS